MKYKCPCCGYYTLPERAGNTYAICPVCFWEDDGRQLENPEQKGGANRVSLLQAKENFSSFGACDEWAIPHVRKPLDDELYGVE